MTAKVDARSSKHTALNIPSVQKHVDLGFMIISHAK